MARDLQFKGTLSIGSLNSGEDGCVRIEVQDDNSHLTFLEIRISHEEFSRAMTGLSNRPMTFDIGDAMERARIGKKLITEAITVKVGPEGDIEYKNRQPRAIAAIAKHCKARSTKDGVHWVGDTYLGSKDSFHSESGMLYANTYMRRWE